MTQNIDIVNNSKKSKISDFTVCTSIENNHVKSLLYLMPNNYKQLMILIKYMVGKTDNAWYNI